ncbi:MAG: hypothetical protein HC844_17595, partial [Tabrizicola sp.]|nr:hypothetical protein [Tabrizicola sp.]
MRLALAVFAPDAVVLDFPAWDCLPYDRVSPNSDVMARRLEVLSRLLGQGARRPDLLIVTVNAFLQKLPTAEVIRSGLFAARAGEKIDRDQLLTCLARNGYHRTGTVIEPGDYAVRGGIIDIFPTGAEQPLRLDLFGDELEAIRAFDPLTQRSLGKVEKIELLPMSEVLLDPASIERFRVGYMQHFGAATADPLFESIVEGRPFPGMEHWLPLFHRTLVPITDYVPAGTPVSFDPLARDAIEARQETIGEHYEARRDPPEAARMMGAAPYRPLAPDELYLSERRIEALHELQEIEECLHVAITRFPTQPIARVLGLIAKRTEVTGEGIVDVFEALRPFWLRADLRRELGSTLFERVASPEKKEGRTPWVRLRQPERSFGWQATTPAELAALQAGQTIQQQADPRPDDQIRIMCERSAGGAWTRSVETLQDADIRRFEPRQEDGSLCRNLMIWRRQREHRLMADPERLNALDREHVPDLAGFLDSSTGAAFETASIAALAQSVGTIEPATVIDAVLSRQWACPEERRRGHGKADFCVHVESFGPVLGPQLFPACEQQHRFWPQDRDFKTASDDVLTGLAFQIRRAVWNAVDHAAPTSGKGKAKAFQALAGTILPPWLRESDAESRDPADWRRGEWQELAAALQGLIEAAGGVVERDPTIRRLIALRTMAREQARMPRDQGP